ncbi:MAG: DUF1570 domain-containing protein [Pirellulaceae bacterium]
MRSPSPHFHTFFAFFALLLAGGVAVHEAPADELKPVTVRVTSGTKSVLGRPVEYTDSQFIMLRRDGRMILYNMGNVDEVDKVSSYFTPYSSLKLQEHYRKLFGDSYEVSRTAHYVVVHPRGMRQRWAEPFEQLYNRFTQYFSVRGYTLKRTEFPMVVVVFNTRDEFNRVADKDGLGNPNSYAGYYSPTSNWIVTCHEAGQQAGDWESNATLIHEALHQYAFNTGIHQRWAPTPKWCAEGLASMFEARGVNNSSRFTSASDRQHEYYVPYLRNVVEQNAYAGVLRSLVASDRLYDENMTLAYATSWGLAWYLSETRPLEFNQYLQRIAARDRLLPYNSSDRLADFARSFGTDFSLLESHFRDYVKQSR